MSRESELLLKIKELETELQKLKKQKRYGLVWEDKPEDVVERCKSELPVLVEDSSKRIIDSRDDLTHILIE
jgi:adenine-specific DNA-methyltransferase